MNVSAQQVDMVRNMSVAEFVAFFENVSVEEMDAWTKKLFAARRDDDETLIAKYRALADHRCKQLHRDAPQMRDALVN
jgi:hypothetical protein